MSLPTLGPRGQMRLTAALPPLVALAFLAVYARTAAPSLLSGDSAELQLAAATLGVAHPTTYPLFTMLGHLATLLVPIGDPARRVTLLSAGCAAGAVGLLCALALRLGAGRRAALLGSLALGVAPGLWNSATLTEVYTLLALLMLALALAVAPPADGRERGLLLGSALPGLLAGLGFTHHGLFAIAALPPFAAWALTHLRGRPLPRLAALAGGFLAGCLPWLYPLAQFARYGPFDGQDYGLPRHYFWGAPRSYAEVLDLLTGGTVRRGIFRIPSPADALATLTMVRERAHFELGWVGLALAAVGCAALLRRSRGAWLASAWVALATLGYLLLLGPAVEDAPTFTLPMLLPAGLWAALGADALLRGAGRLPDLLRRGPRPRAGAALAWLLAAALLGLGLRWADTRVEYASKRHLTLYRTFGEAVLDGLPPGAVVIAHWEQGMALQYLRLVEGRRPDVWVDVVEPGDSPWGPRARARYAGRPVFMVGQAPDVEGLPVELVREDDYALVFQLRR